MCHCRCLSFSFCFKFIVWCVLVIWRLPKLNNVIFIILCLLSCSWIPMTTLINFNLHKFPQRIFPPLRNHTAPPSCFLYILYQIFTIYSKTTSIFFTVLLFCLWCNVLEIKRQVSLTPGSLDTTTIALLPWVLCKLKIILQNQKSTLIPFRFVLESNGKTSFSYFSVENENYIFFTKKQKKKNSFSFSFVWNLNPTIWNVKAFIWIKFNFNNKANFQIYLFIGILSQKISTIF